MPIPVSSILPVVAAQGAASEVAFQPGSTIAGRVLSVSPDNQARIAIGHSTIEVQTQVPLQAGQVLQFAVSKTDTGDVRLAVLPQNTSAAQTSGASGGSVTLAPDASISLINAIATSKVQLTSLEAQAVSTATQTAVTQQASLATLFADLGAVTSLQSLPPQLQQAVAQVLAQRPPLDAQLTGDEVKSAFQNSGLFLEASLAQAATGKATLPQGAMPDMKAALIVLRQALSATLESASPSKSTVPGAMPGQDVQAPAANAQPQTAATTVTQQAQAAAAAATLVPAMMTKPATKGDPLQQAGLVVADDATDIDPQMAATMTAAKAPALRAAVTSAALGLLQEALQSPPKGAGTAASLAFDDNIMLDLLPGGKAQTAPLAPEMLAARPTIPPPPLRGALPTAQPMAQPSLPANASMSAAVHKLLGDTDAALARQTLLQVASLPDRADMASPRLDQASPRWSFEIPFAVPAGTAMAQFEISRDGGNDTEAEAAQRVWRARFSLDIEPAGPVHALVSLTGDKTSVRMWAERPTTALQLQAGTAQLTQALVRANLRPGDIVVREGAPVQAAPAAAGHFLDRAL